MEPSSPLPVRNIHSELMPDEGMNYFYVQCLRILSLGVTFNNKLGRLDSFYLTIAIDSRCGHMF